MLSLCMIVKNEEKNLEKCLNNIVEYIKDIVIVDTGSTDATKKIAKKYTNKVYDFKWCGDFSKARNFSISKASNDWVLILDADEVVYKFEKEKIEEFIKGNNKTVGRIKRINPFEDGEEIKKYIERVNRLFNKNYFHYEGIIHEQVVSKDGNKYDMSPIEIEANHIGYLNEVISGTNKLERNINLLIDAINDNPIDPYLHYQIGKSYYRKKDYNKAYDSFSKSVKLCTDFKFEYTEDLMESYGYTLLKCEKYTEAMKLNEYKNYYVNSPDYNFIMGLIYMNNGKFQESVDCFEKCIGEKEGKIEGINSYQPNYNIGVIYETLGFKEEALRFYKLCGEYLLAKKRIEKMIDKKKEGIENSQINLKNINEVKNNIQRYIEDANLAEAKMLLKEALEVSNNDLELYSMKSVIEIMENRLEDAEKTLKYSLEIDNKNFDILHNMGYLYEIKGEYQLAVDFYSRALMISKSETMQKELEEYINNIKINIFKTSIIILTYNNLDYNKICIESIRKYTKNNNYEIIVVDNNSTDGTVEWLKEQKDIRVIYNKENLGFPKGCNQGIKMATGEEILLLNNDTIVTPGWLENLRECLYSSESIGAVGPVTNSCPNYQSIPINYDSVEDMIEFAEKYNYGEPKKWEERLRLIGYCMLIKKEVIDKVGLLDEIFTPGNFEDDDYSLRMRKAGYKLILCKNSFIHHFGSASFEKKSKEFSELLIKNREKFFEKWGFDPYHIVEIRKDITELIAKSDKEEINVLHIGCKGGGTLLDIKNGISSAMLYGIEEINEASINSEYFTQIELGNVEKINKFKKNQFEFIITQSQESEEEIINILSSVKSYLRENGIINMILTHKKLNSNRNLIKNLETRTDNYLFKSIRNNEEQILVIEKTKINRKDNTCKLTIYKKEDIENINEECTLDSSQVEGSVEQILIRRLDNNLEFQRNLNLLEELILNNRIDCEKVKDVVVNFSINKISLLNIIATLYYEYKFADETLMLLSEAFKLDGENKDTIYNIASVLLEAKENKMALDFLNGISNIDKDEELMGLKQQIEEAI
jgi:GT2 family glycosyltransferase